MNKSNFVIRRLNPGLLTFLFLLLTASLCEVQAKSPGFFQQNKTVKGKITDDQGKPVEGASVLQKGTSNGTTTSATGDFSISVPDNATLVVTSVGFADQEISVGTNSTINLQLKGLSQSLTDVVVVGYATQKRVTVTGSVTQVKGTDLDKSPSTNLSNSLAGRLPGVTAMQRSGEPGYDGSTIRIRGTNTLGNSAPLVVIDGVPDRAGGLERLNPADVETFVGVKRCICRHLWGKGGKRSYFDYN